MKHTKGKVLIVDDELISMETLHCLLADEYEVFMANSGKKALEIAVAELPDVILLDIMMPEMDGYEVFRKILANKALSDISVLFITAMTESECESRGLELGAHDYLVKPYNPSLVKLRVRNHIAFKKRNDLVKKQRDELAKNNTELEAALARIIRLEGLITICMYCKQIRNESDTWEQLEKYITEHSGASFSHGICPKCVKNNYPGYSASKKIEDESK